MFWQVVATVVIVPVMLVLLNGAYNVLYDEGPSYRAVLLTIVAVLVDVLLLFVLEAMWT